MHPNRRSPRTDSVPLASRPIRLFSTAIDSFLLLTLYFGICASYLVAENEELCGLIPYVLLFVYEIVTGTSPAKQALGLAVAFDAPGFQYRVYRALAKYGFIPFLVYPSMLFTKRRQGLHDMVAKAVVVRTANRGAWLRAMLATLLTGYLLLTFGCGRFLSLIMADRYDPYLVNLQPEPWTPESSAPATWLPRWQQGGRVDLPDSIDRFPLHVTPYLNFYSSSIDRRRGAPSVIVMLNVESHPYVEYCIEPSPVLRWALPCDASPREAQKALFESVVDDTVFFDPRRIIGENAKRFGKSFLLDGDELLTFRAHDGVDQSVIWYAIARYDDDGELVNVVDHVNIAGEGADDHYTIMVFWSGVARQEAVVSGLVASFQFDAGGEELARDLLESGQRSRSPLDLLNALELAEDKLRPAEALFARYGRDGSSFERAQFADWVSYRVRDGDLRFMDLNEKVWDWRPPEADEADSR